jgi:predicted transcriptional regulator
MTSAYTTIRVSQELRDRLRQLAVHRASSISDTLDAALRVLEREEFYRSMADAEAALETDPIGHAQFIAERDLWLTADLAMAKDRRAHLRQPEAADSTGAEAEAWSNE